MKKLEFFIKKIYHFIIDDMIFPFIQIIMSIFVVLLCRKKNDKKKALILTQERIGDTLIRLNLLERYNGFFDEAYFLAFDGNKEIVELISDRIICIDERKITRNIFYRWHFILKLNIMNFDTAVFLVPYSGMYSNSLLYRYLLIKNKFINRDNYDSSYVLDRQVNLYNYITNQRINVSDVKPDMKKYLLKKNIDLSEKLISILPKEYIVINMGSLDKRRMYPIEKFEKVVKYLIDKNENLVFLGRGVNDSEYYKSIKIKFQKNITNFIDFIDKLTIIESFLVISKAKMFIGVESGLWNSAYALNIPSVVIYGGGNYGRFLHRDDNISYIYTYLDCYGCKWHCKYFDGNTEKAKCINDIEPSVIIDGINVLTNKLSDISDNII